MPLKLPKLKVLLMGTLGLLARINPLRPLSEDPKPEQPAKLNINMSLDPAAAAMLLGLINKTEHRNASATLVSALALYDMALDVEAEGGCLFVQDKEGRAQPVLLRK